MYNRENVIAVKEEFRKKADRAAAEAEQRKAEVYAKSDDIRKFDNALVDCYKKLINIVLDTSVDRDDPEVKKQIDIIRDDSLQIRRDRKKCLVHFGYPEDYTDPKFECEKCSDTGYVGINMCECMKKALIKAGFESSGLGALLETQSFENFDLSYYADAPGVYQAMEYTFDACVKYAEGFNKNRENENILFIGATGLGKTHLSTAIAKKVIENGSDVLYKTAIDVFSDFEHDRFNRRFTDTDEPASDKYFTCDLLIIDDLGTELTNQFTVSVLYNLINKRTIAKRPIIINTNLGIEDLKKRYESRITSRILGDFRLYMFKGKDIREKKIAEHYEKKHH